MSSSASLVPFGARLSAAFAATGHLCVGIDPHDFLLEQWGLPRDALGAREFGLRVVAAAEGVAGIVKPQVAFFERFGAVGYQALEDVLVACRDAGLLVIADAKRGDVGSTVEAYASAWLTPGAPLEADAMTISAYQGLGSIDDARALALASGKGLFVLSATSNPESFEPQRAVIASGDNMGKTVAGAIMNGAAHWNTTEPGLGSIGVVIGATVALHDYGVNSALLRSTPILAPGFGHQGAQYSEIPALYGVSADNVLVSASRSILAAGPTGIAAAIRTETRLIGAVYS